MIILSGNLLFLVIFYKKFKEPFGNVLFTVGQSAVFVSMLMTFAWELFYYMVSRKVLWIIITLCIFAQAGYLIARLLYVENGIKKGKYKDSCDKRRDPVKASGFMITAFVLCKIVQLYLVGYAWWGYFWNILILGMGFLFLAGGWDGWIMYRYFKKLSPREQDLVLGKNEERDRRKPGRRRSVVSINKLGGKK